MVVRVGGGEGAIDERSVVEKVGGVAFMTGVSKLNRLRFRTLYFSFFILIRFPQFSDVRELKRDRLSSSP